MTIVTLTLTCVLVFIWGCAASIKYYIDCHFFVAVFNVYCYWPLFASQTAPWGHWNFALHYLISVIFTNVKYLKNYMWNFKKFKFSHIWCFGISRVNKIKYWHVFSRHYQIKLYMHSLTYMGLVKWDYVIPSWTITWMLKRALMESKTGQEHSIVVKDYSNENIAEQTMWIHEIYQPEIY